MAHTNERGEWTIERFGIVTPENEEVPSGASQQAHVIIRLPNGHPLSLHGWLTNDYDKGHTQLRADQKALNDNARLIVTAVNGFPAFMAITEKICAYHASAIPDELRAMAVEILESIKVSQR